MPAQEGIRLPSGDRYPSESSTRLRRPLTTRRRLRTRSFRSNIRS